MKTCKACQAKLQVDRKEQITIVQTGRPRSRKNTPSTKNSADEYRLAESGGLRLGCSEASDTVRELR